MKKPALTFKIKEVSSLPYTQLNDDGEVAEEAEVEEEADVGAHELDGLALVHEEYEEENWEIEKNLTKSDKDNPRMSGGLA